jgi:phage/conjugal plasmid C-4 type zinc finger TraR family protein
VSDEADRAEVLESFQRDLAVRAARAGAAHLGAPAAFGLCDDCGGPIEAARRAAAPGCTRCVSCQAAFEAAGRIPIR